MDIKPALVKELRERTGAGMMDCKRALVEAGGDIDSAAELLASRARRRPTRRPRASRPRAVAVKSDDARAAMRSSR